MGSKFGLHLLLFPSQGLSVTLHILHTSSMIAGVLTSASCILAIDGPSATTLGSSHESFRMASDYVVDRDGCADRSVESTECQWNDGLHCREKRIMNLQR